ncbi:hypothetical protein RBI13_18620 [Alcaligenaceae bacterium A4P071]|nr:hypothetical protein [Alcaligenaceae bacterium A4P071]
MTKLRKTVYFFFGLTATLFSATALADEQNLCPERSPEQLEQAVVRHWESKLSNRNQKVQADSFFREHKFFRDEIKYSAPSSLWGLPFTMFNTRTNKPVKFVAIIDCNGYVELSVDES